MEFLVSLEFFWKMLVLANDLSSSQSSQIKRVCTRVRLTILQLLLSYQFERYNKNDWDGNVLSAQVKNGKKYSIKHK